MVGQGIQKHNPDSTDEGYITRSPTPTSCTHLEDDVLDTTLSSELHITEEDSEGSYPTEHNENIDESEGEDTLNVSYETCTEYIEDMDKPEHEDALSVLNETHQSERDWLDDHMDEFENFLETINRVQPCVTIYQQVDKSMQESTLHALQEKEWQQVNTLNSNETTAARTIRESLELIALGEDKKIMFGMPCYVFSQNTSLIDFLVRNLYQPS
ncbi:hypothetical protein [Wolbachia endosymbiont of Oedothorax gibbosus]|uniref:hypothetical protein n=1 Tax=Wolbachia endosymbiont of Oedothorax gibbosus TaxID=931100 RepID=UPI002025492C|nr:hypothetical protein [Wolbachia endosymbiont of Oedothorax gibbosus]